MSERFINCHSHIFNEKCAPDRFIGLPVARMISERKMLVKGMLKVMRLVGSSSEASVEKWANFLDIGSSKSQADVFDSLRASYTFGPMAYVALTLNMDYMGAGTALLNFQSQLAEVRQLKLSYLNELIPFICVDPRSGNPDAVLDTVKIHLERYGFGGIKLYPPLGFYPFDPRLEKIYAYAEQYQIPVLTHTSQGGIFYQGDELSMDHMHPMTFGNNRARRVRLDGTTEDRDLSFSEDVRKTRRFLGKTWGKGKRNEEFKLNFADPMNYLIVLKRFPQLKLCMAHFGGDGQIEKFVLDSEQRNPSSGNWHSVVCEILKKYPNTYADVSYALWQKSIWNRLKDCIRGPLAEGGDISKQILFGTDYFMTLQEKTEVRLVNDFRAELNRDEFNRIAVLNPANFLATHIPYAQGNHQPV
jgi:predicted TIM-barrel fold metal-dependent hydrolase